MYDLSGEVVKGDWEVPNERAKAIQLRAINAELCVQYQLDADRDPLAHLQLNSIRNTKRQMDFPLWPEYVYSGRPEGGDSCQLLIANTTANNNLRLLNDSLRLDFVLHTYQYFNNGDNITDKNYYWEDPGIRWGDFWKKPAFWITTVGMTASVTGGLLLRNARKETDETLNLYRQYLRQPTQDEAEKVYPEAVDQKHQNIRRRDRGSVLLVAGAATALTTLYINHLQSNRYKNFQNWLQIEIEQQQLHPLYRSGENTLSLSATITF